MFAQMCENITILQNNILESDRSFTLMLILSVGNDFFAIGRDTAVVSIVDNDSELELT